MQQAPGIESNIVDMKGQRAARATSGKFPGILDSVSYAAQVAGPVAAVSTAQYGSPKAAAIVAAGVNSAAGYGGATGLGLTPGVYSGGVSNYYGGRPLAADTGNGASGTSDDMLQMAQNQLAESQASSIAMLMVQDEMGSQNRVYTSASNLMNSRDTMLASIIRNVRVG